MAVLAASLTHLTAQTDPTEILVEKVIAHTQTGASAVNLASGDPYTFYSEVIMDSGSYSGAFTVGGVNKTLTEQGGGEYLFEQSFSSQAAMDAEYANTASYSFTNPGGTDFTFDQNNGTPTFKHANAPVVTLGGGSWVGNVYQIQNGQSLSVQSTVTDDTDAYFMYGWIDLIDNNDNDPHLSSDDIAGGGPHGTGSGNLEISGGMSNISLALGQYTVEALHFYRYDFHENDGGDITGIPPSDGELNGAFAMYGLGSMTTLTIEVVPEPSQAALLIGIVAIAMVGLRRRVNF